MWCWRPNETSYALRSAYVLHGIGTCNFYEELPFWSLPWTSGLRSPIKNIENNLTLVWTI